MGKQHESMTVRVKRSRKRNRMEMRVETSRKGALSSTPEKNLGRRKRETVKKASGGKRRAKSCSRTNTAPTIRSKKNTETNRQPRRGRRAEQTKISKNEINCKTAYKEKKLV